METYSRWYGRYPYPEVDVVTGQFPYGSMEYPTFVTAVPFATAVATPGEFGAAAQAASPVDLTGFWERWRVDVQ
ncbi:hypothetical protein [Actinophytocola algeriensis]|uniref:N-acetyl-gamma-glutamylphosphate reductase n=2 Tax=Actinophytocola algeriensis TaxID=1768010 RepID=A0A7W7Q8C0_9PSEU|nr:hypothetical protein [Actinophytocola algeriensis]MBB4908930.1 N-acetyl-gamma-glutamylphosphate reductase [Actinophytocola algeriensis]